MDSGAPTIRPATTADAAAIADIYAGYVEQSVASFEQLAPDEAEIRHRMTDAGMPWLVADVDGTVLGYAYAGPHNARAAYRWAVNVSVYLRPEARGRGTGRALYNALLPKLRSLGYFIAVAGITLPNDASVRLHESFGFQLVGVYPKVGFKFGAWYDVGWWQLELAPRPEDPDEPVRVGG